MPTVAPYGSWKSPVSAELIAQAEVRVSFPGGSLDTLYWLEGRPAEQGRVVLVRRRPDGSTEDVFGPQYSARTLVHEYGGLCYAVDGDVAYFSNFSDQRLYRSRAGFDPEPITAEPASPRSVRFGAPALTPDGQRLYCVRERHGRPGVADEVVNDLVVVATDGAATPQVVAEGHDFFSFPTLSPDGGRLAWVAWDHPRMPWDGSELFEAELDAEGLPGPPRRVAGGPAESVSQPAYSPDGRLHFVSDRSGWWNLYRDDGAAGSLVLEAPVAEEFGGPDWALGLRWYCFCGDGSIAAISSHGGVSRLSTIAPGGHRAIVPSPFHVLGMIAPLGRDVVLVAGSPRQRASVVSVSPASGAWRALKQSGEVVLDPAVISEAEAIEFPTEGGLTAHAFFYPPRNPAFEAPPGDLPPVIVASHGGPTGSTSDELDYSVQYWTSRGIGVVAVNYGGSSGYGRAYRDRLRGAWGVVDLDDCVNAARSLVDSGRADGGRLLVHGRSAGGYTTLCALTFRSIFAAGASYYGVGDAGALARDTHKFESHYCDGLIGPWPEARALYEERSPLFHADQMHTPMILLQGLEDEVVPPAQAEAMAAVLRSKGVPFAYVAFAGEQHGFRKAENITTSLQAELYFYGKILGFEPADDLPGVEIENPAGLERSAS